jgi:PAS domain S-box-containing protein
MLFLVIGAGILTYFFKNVLETGIIFTHFFYIPIVMACVWWKLRGLMVTVLLSIVLVAGQYLFSAYSITVNDAIRIAMLFVISVITVLLSEQLTATKDDLSASEEKYRTIFETTGSATVIVDNEKTILLMNREFERLSGFRKDIVEHQKLITDFVDECDRERVESYHWQRRGQPYDAPKSYEFKFVNRKGDVRYVFANVDLIRGTSNSVISLLDITELKQVSESQRILQQRLAETLERVVSGFIPICARCKKIRSEDDNWIEIESFLQDKTKADFSHGICPDCAMLLYPDILSGS